MRNIFVTYSSCLIKVLEHPTSIKKNYAATPINNERLLNMLTYKTDQSVRYVGYHFCFVFRS
jgi:hypothetical protein